MTEELSKGSKIDDLLQDALLNNWVKEGKGLHQHKREKCTFCDNPISTDRWAALEKHFDESSNQLEKSINQCIAAIEAEKATISTVLRLDRSQFYSTFVARVDALEKRLDLAIEKYQASLDQLIIQLAEKNAEILQSKTFVTPENNSDELIAAWEAFNQLKDECNEYSKQLNAEQSAARDSLRLNEVYSFQKAIDYSSRETEIERLKNEMEAKKLLRDEVEHHIQGLEDSIVVKKQSMNDEQKGAVKVNEYLQDFFGHDSLSLQPINNDDSVVTRFEVTRNNQKAYHLSEGECSLLAFCYFVARLDDTETVGNKPVIWIDDPISSLDGNHVFFIYSVILSEIVGRQLFSQLFISTHNLEFLKYLKRLNGKYSIGEGALQDYNKAYFIVARCGEESVIQLMPKYLKEYVTEFNYLFHQIYRCASIANVDDSNYTLFYNFGNNARKFFEIYLYYKYPDQGMTQDTLTLFFSGQSIPSILIDRINNEYSHLAGVFERGSTPVEVPEMHTSA